MMSIISFCCIVLLFGCIVALALSLRKVRLGYDEEFRKRLAAEQAAHHQEYERGVVEKQRDRWRRRLNELDPEYVKAHDYYSEKF